jgi:spore coat protein A, manganese oxidase
MRLSRRDFLKLSVAAGIGLSTGMGRLLFESRRAYAFAQSRALGKFIQPLRGVFPLDPGGIPVAVPDGALGVARATHYSINVHQYTDMLHPALGPTTLRGYQPSNILGGNAPQRHLGGIIVAQKGKPVQITFTNQLSGNHPIPIDQTIMGANLGQNRVDTHLHGGFVPWISDGGPHAWFDPQGGYGPSVPLSTYKLLNPNLQPGQAEYYYPNDQSARFAWYHDHTFGITRMNAYVGIASAYVIRDSFEGFLRNLGLPDYIENGGREIPLVIQDKIFVGDDILTVDPTWTGASTPGSLWYAHTYEPDRWDLGAGVPLPDPSVVPEFFGDTMLANGTVFPKAIVEARRYRLRVLNACQARFLNLQLYVDDGSADGITLDSSMNPTNQKGPDFLVLGTEGGFLPRPVRVPSNRPFNQLTLGGSLITAPAERWDLLVDFAGFAGKKVILYSDAPAPFPGGDPRNDYFPGAPDNPTQPTPGFGPNTRQIMEFEVVSATGAADPHLYLSPITPLVLGNDPLPVPIGSTSLPRRVPVRRLTLNETFDDYGRLIQLLGTDTAPGSGQGFGRGYMDSSTENITLKGGVANEVWQIINLTGDTHPIHFHLANVQIISRQPFDVDHYQGGEPTFIGPAVPPRPEESGWKETVRVNPGEVVNVYIPFRLPKVPFKVPSSPRTGGSEYVWHCHILEHEEHDMMRPLVVS